MAARRITLAATLSVAGAVVTSGTVSEATVGAANPVRKVVNLLQAMQKKVTAEGEKSEELHKKFMCYCSSSGGALSASVAAAENKIPEVESAIKAATQKKVQLEADLKGHQKDRASAKAAMAEATSLRQKEKATYDNALADSKQNLAALTKATAAIDQGMAGAFLQTRTAATLRALVMGKQDMLNADRQDIMAFLDQGGQYAPASGEISGILKPMADEMSVDQSNLVSVEQGAVTGYEGLMAAKQKEVATLSKAVEEKTARVGNLGIEIATMNNDLEDTSEGLAADRTFAADLKKSCGERQGIHDKEKQLRADEVVALADTIKILNDDDALDLFKKTLPSASASLVQLQDSSMARQMRARAVLERVMKPGQHRNLDFVLLALRGRKVGFEKIVKLIDGLVATLQTEQQDDAHKKEYCAAQFDHAEDKQKGLERSIADLGTVIEEAKEGQATLAEEIKALKAGVVALDKAVADATDQRKAESAAYKELMASNGAAKELILFAKNRMNKFYNPGLHKAAPKTELSAGDRIYENEGGEIPTAAPGGIANTGIAFTQLSSRIHDAPAPPPEVAAAYSKKSQESNGVFAMMDLLVQDLDKEMTEAKTDETNAQEEYERTMSESAEKRTQDSKSLTDKEAAHADLGASLETSAADKKSAGTELMGTMKYISSLKAECDWLLQYFDVRKAARTEEIDSLQKAKAVLSGADFSFVQQESSDARSRKFLHHG